MFDEQVEPVVNAGFQMLTSDLRGHGASLADAKYDTSVTDMARDQLALLDSLGHNGPVHLVGQSLGGMVAQHVVRLAPERVRSLVTIGAPCVTPESRRIAATLATVWRVSGGITGLMPEAAIRRQLPAGTAVKPHVQEYVRGATENLTKRDFRWLVRVSREAGRRLPGYRVECPVLILRGEHDASGAGKLTALTGPRWARRDPRARYEVLPGAGHQAHQDQPEAFNQILLDFLAR
ncbi:alpha/beta hydrolase [Phytoactinopolyspora alkaliphila]|uniref:Alpha/beta hydrolase n=2 Tax=Phytoactinopolyspora alkaliphila TaxID=1783498 RepID=A0A6N9YMU4_9ACTN|nr:alpha/beta hydrolase [Phytoactinopolyspora alkaliphila]